MSQVANIIKQQLGGNKFMAMTGAKNYNQNDTSLSLYFPKLLIKNKGNILTISLKQDDTYTLQFSYLDKNMNLNEESIYEEVYAGMLHDIISDVTGLVVSL